MAGHQSRKKCRNKNPVHFIFGGGSVNVDFLFIVTLIVGVCNCSIICFVVRYVMSILVLQSS